jgi:hypothetical protein
MFTARLFRCQACARGPARRKRRHSGTLEELSVVDRGVFILEHLGGLELTPNPLEGTGIHKFVALHVPKDPSLGVNAR